MPPVVRLSPLLTSLFRFPVSQLSRTLLLPFDSLGGRLQFDPVFELEPIVAPRTLTRAPPTTTSLGGLCTVSRNRILLFERAFLSPCFPVSRGGVGGRTDGSAFRISSGRYVGKSCVVRRFVVLTSEPCRVTELSDCNSSCFGFCCSEMEIDEEKMAFGFEAACAFRRCSCSFLLSFFAWLCLYIRESQ